MSKACTYCHEMDKHGHPWEGMPPQCAFDKGYFDGRSNWRCGTMTRLRAIARNSGWIHQQDDDSIAYIPIAEADEDGTTGYIVLSWYKDRGRTHHALMVNCDRPVIALTVDLAEAVIAKYAGRQVSAS